MPIEIESIINGFYNHVDDINDIQCVDDLIESLHEYLITIKSDIDEGFMLFIECVWAILR